MALASLSSIETYLTTIVISLVILLAGFALGFLARKFLRRILQEVELNRILRSVDINTDLEQWLSLLVSLLIYLTTMVIFLNYWDIKSLVLYLFLGAILLLIILTVLVGLKDVIPNLIGWLYLQKNNRIKEGRNVEINDISGTVERVGYLETEIRTGQGDVLYVPNSLFLKKKHRVKQ